MVRRVIIAVVTAGVAVAALGCAAARASGSHQQKIAAAGCTGAALKPITVGRQPGPIVITPDGKTAYVANAASGTVTPIRTATNTALKPVKVGHGPLAVAVTPDGGTAYVADYEGDTVAPIKTATNTALKLIKVGRQPDSLAITPNGRAVYAVNYTSGEGPGTVTPIRNCPNV